MDSFQAKPTLTNRNSRILESQGAELCCVSWEGQVQTWFPCALLCLSTRTRYGHKRDLPKFQSKYWRIITLGLKFQMSITSSHRWPMRSTLQQSNGLYALFKSTRQHSLKMQSDLLNICFRLSIWPNRHRESQKYGFVKWIPTRTNEADGLIVLSPNSAQKATRFPCAFLSRSRKNIN